jgi:hypothetical protein
MSKPPLVTRPANLEEAAFWPVTHLSQLIKTRQVRSVELTEMYLDRLKRYDDKLKFVVTLTPDLAMEQAKRADAKIAVGRYRGPLHGIPWGAKDLISKRGYKTTWDAAPFKVRLRRNDRERLEDAGAVFSGQAQHGRARRWRCLVRRADEESMESRGGFQRLFGRTCVCYCGRLRELRYRHRNGSLHRRTPRHGAAFMDCAPRMDA